MRVLKERKQNLLNSERKGQQRLLKASAIDDYSTWNELLREGGAPCDPRFPHHNTNKHRVLTELLLSPAAAAAMKNRVKG